MNFLLYNALLGILVGVSPIMAMVNPHDLAEDARHRAYRAEQELKEQQAVENQLQQALPKIIEVYEQHGIDVTQAPDQEQNALMRIGWVFLGKTAIPVHGRQDFTKMLNMFQGFHPELFRKYSGLRTALEELLEKNEDN